MPSVSANNLNYNNNNHLYPQGYIKRQNPNINDGQLKSILQDNREKLPKDFDEDYIMKFRVKNEQIQPPNNKTELQKDKILNNDLNHQTQGNNEHLDNPILKIMNYGKNKLPNNNLPNSLNGQIEKNDDKPMDKQLNDRNSSVEKQESEKPSGVHINNGEGNQDDKQDISFFTFGPDQQSSENKPEGNTGGNRQSGNNCPYLGLQTLCPCLCWKE